MWELQEFSRELTEKCGVRIVHTNKTSYVYRMLCEYVSAFMIPDLEPEVVEEMTAELTENERRVMSLLSEEEQKSINVWD